jgi:UDP-4-amino-4,6-dideoxy-N-acetyl-beta-L-altrosamine N-acetyltransferase
MIDLRDLGEGDCERLFLWRRNPRVDRWMHGSAFQSFERHELWYDTLRSDRDRRGWIITVEGRPAGLLTLTGLAGPDRRGEWGWYIGEDWALGRGVGKAAQALGLDRAFGDFALEKVCAEVLAENEIALRAQIGAGFRREGYLRSHVLKDGLRRDVVCLGLLFHEWAARREALRAGLVAAGLLAASTALRTVGEGGR